MSEERQEAKACREYEARLEDALAGGAAPAVDPELAAHLAQCAGCGEALRAARQAQALLQGGIGPTAEAHPALVTRVMAEIRDREADERQKASEFWAPIEQLARRLAWAATLALLVLGSYELGLQSGRNDSEMTSINGEPRELFPDPNRLPIDKDEVVERLAGSNNGR